MAYPRRTFYNWYQKYATGGVNALRETPYRRQTTWNRIPDHIRQILVELSLEHPELTPRELSVLLLEESQIFVSESSFYRILHERGLLERMEHDFIFAADEFHHKTKFANEMWQTDFTYFKVKGWGWYYLSTVIDDYSRYIIHWELCSSMDEWVDYYNEKRFHESLDNLTPKDVYLGQGERIKKIREIIKQKSINKRIYDNKTMKYQSK